MEPNEIVERGRLLNIIIIVINILTYLLYTIGRFSETNTVYTLQIVIRVLGVVGAIGVIVFTAILLKQNEGRMKGLGLLLAASIVSLIFSALGFMLGIVIWILCGISMSMLQKSFKEYSETLMYSNIQKNLYEKNTVYGNNNNYSGDPFAGNAQGYDQGQAYGNNQPYGGNQTYGGDPFAGNTQGYDQGQTYGNNQPYGGNQTYGGDPFAGNAQGYSGNTDGNNQ